MKHETQVDRVTRSYKDNNTSKDLAVHTEEVFWMGAVFFFTVPNNNAHPNLMVQSDGQFLILHKLY